MGPVGRTILRGEAVSFAQEWDRTDAHLDGTTVSGLLIMAKANTAALEHHDGNVILASMATARWYRPIVPGDLLDMEVSTLYVPCAKGRRCLTTVSVLSVGLVLAVFEFDHKLKEAEHDGT